MDVLPWLMVVFGLLNYEHTCIGAQSTRVRMCYISGKSMKLTGFTVSMLSPTSCTHLIYDFATISANGRALDLTTSDANTTDRLKTLTEFKEKNPLVKLLLSVRNNYNKVTNDTVKVFVRDALKFMTENNFDGFDLHQEVNKRQDWEELRNLAIGMSNTMKNMKIEKKPLLTVPVWKKPKYLIGIRSRKRKSIIHYVDYFLLETYKLWGRWYSRLAHHAPLDVEEKYLKPKKDPQMSRNSIKRIVDWWIGFGVSPSKLVLGLAFFGISATLKKDDLNKIGDTFPGTMGQEGPVSKSTGLLYYSEICQKVSKEKWTETYIGTNEGAIAYKDLQWVSYDNPQSIYKKTEFALKKSLAGVYIWTVDEDRLDNACDNKTFPLLSKVIQAFEDNKDCTNTTFSCPKEWTDGYLKNQHPDPASCNFFYQCTSPGTEGSVFTRMPCPADLHYSPKTAKCENPKDANCKSCDAS